MRVLQVTGSRDFGVTVQERRAIANDILTVERDEGDFGILIHGAAKGVDRAVAEWFEEQHRHVLSFPACWNVTDNTPMQDIRVRADGTKYDMRAGFRRNQLMASVARAYQDEGHDVLVMAWQRRLSRGTQHMIDICRSRGLEVRVYKV